MKAWQVIAGSSSAILIVLGGGLIVTNPSQHDYEEYAVQQLSHYLRQSVCNQLPEEFQHLGSECRSLGQTLIDTGRPQLEQLIFEQTERQNYVLFSTYRTRLAFSTLTPIYEFQTVGILQHFYIYDIRQL
ncbi:MAG: DUF4359 domain-containing protein [Spirulinaceae cyanobacterium RM2_2_10]|nr:DUF4359 domain-containing protein [Spirulinaceae cyanobacterium SM2_1_0]NJO20615.1 DUF4359 domain-containing protein [Spirulinaceae cyanobacterium RM2_2_10]